VNTQEREQLTQFLQQLTQAQVPQKDIEADALIREASMRQPDATYSLVQRAMPVFLTQAPSMTSSKATWAIFHDRN